MKTWRHATGSVDEGTTTEAEARAALRAFVGNVEPWIAEQSWEAAQRGLTVAGELPRPGFRGFGPLAQISP